MTAPTPTCVSCDTPMPDGAMYCPACGVATPTEIARETGEHRTPPSSGASEAEYRQRLQRALGDGYELREMIGQGGFGAVYAVWDVELQREVAVKALRHDLFPSPDLLERFRREARAVAKLRHANVLPVYAVGEGEGIAFMVMPKVEGENLKTLLVREGQLSVDEAVRITTEAARGLQVAHDAGIVHRDVKPENILLEGEERHVLLMDFGIAKAAAGAGTAITATGMMIGTPLYMSPEQADGSKDIDHRSDIYAMGCVLFEMLAGDPPFGGRNTLAIISRHIADTPPRLDVVRPGLPRHITKAVEKALAKVPADRFGTVTDFSNALGTAEAPRISEAPTEQAAGRPGRGVATPASPQPAAAPTGRRRLGPVAIGGLAVAMVAGSLWTWLLRDTELTIVASNNRQVTAAPGVEFQPTLSPDGSEVAFLAGPIATPRVVVRSTIDIASGGESHPAADVPGNHWNPSWSPDGASVTFHACPRGDPGSPLWIGCSWRQVGKLGGSPRTLTLPRNTRRYAWSPDGTRVAFSSGDSLFSYAFAETAPVLLGVQVVDPWSPHSLAWSPDGRWIAYVNGNPAMRTTGHVGESSIWLIAAAGGEPIPITDEDGMNVSPQWLPDSRHILFVSDRDGARAAYAVEVGADGARGEARPVPGVADAHGISVSADGRRLAYSKFTRVQNIWSIPIPRSGVASIRDAVPVTTGSRVVESHSLSMDEQWIVFDVYTGRTRQVYKVPVAGGIPQVLTDLGSGPNWSPDGTEISFGRWSGSAGGKADLFLMSAEGESPTRLTDFPWGDVQPDWSPDGLHLAYQSQGPSGAEAWTLWMLSRDTVGGTWSAPTRVMDSTCHSPAWAPDGGSIFCALWCTECRPPGPENALLRVSVGGEVLSRFPIGNPEWVTRPKPSRDGSRLYFVGSESDGSMGLWSMPVDGGEPTKVVALDDPELSLVRLTGHSDGVLSVGEEHIYITLAEYESDIWVVDLEVG